MQIDEISEAQKAHNKHGTVSEHAKRGPGRTNDEDDTCTFGRDDTTPSQKHSTKKQQHAKGNIPHELA